MRLRDFGWGDAGKRRTQGAPCVRVPGVWDQDRKELGPGRKFYSEMSPMRKTVFGHVRCFMTRIPKFLLFALALLLMDILPVYALNPQHEGAFKEALAKLTQSVDRLNEKLGIVFQPGQAKGERESGLEEIAWRARDLQEQTQKLQRLCQAYWKNETAVVGVLDHWSSDAKLIDEAMIYSPAPKDVSDLWKGTKELAVEVRDWVEEIPSPAEWEKVAQGFGFDIVKVGRYPKKQVLREKVKEFIGESQLDKWPFPDERRDLDPKDLGEHFLVRFKVQPRSGAALDLPLKLRFEYKFAQHQYDGTEQLLYTHLKTGSHDFLFKNQGVDFAKRGKIIHWRASLLLNEKVVAQKKSPMWKVTSEWAAPALATPAPVLPPAPMGGPTATPAARP